MSVTNIYHYLPMRKIWWFAVAMLECHFWTWFLYLSPSPLFGKASRITLGMHGNTGMHYIILYLLCIHTVYLHWAEISWSRAWWRYSRYSLIVQTNSSHFPSEPSVQMRDHRSQSVDGKCLVSLPTVHRQWWRPARSRMCSWLRQRKGTTSHGA